MKVKVCGLTNRIQANDIAQLGADYIGFIGYKKSPRYAWDKISAKEVSGIKNIQKVGVFVNEAVDKILEIGHTAKLDLIQLHGHENIEDVKAVAKKLPVIKAIQVRKGQQDLPSLVELYSPYVNYFLFDTASKAYGGSGEQFDWKILEQLEFDKPYFLSGGIDKETTLEDSIFKREPFAIDINSKFEISPGLKDIDKIKEFISLNRFKHK